MRRRVRGAGWGLLALAVLVVAVVVTVGASRARGAAAFNWWVGWATVAALPVAALGVALVIWEKISPSEKSGVSFGKAAFPGGNRNELVTRTIPRPTDVDLPGLLDNLPRLPVRVFLGREAAQGLLAQALARRGEAIITQAVYGLGGVGKTELALRHAHDHRADYKLVWWITATSSSQVRAGLATLAERLWPTSSMTGAMQDAAGWALGWLQVHKGWLLILDDVNEPADVEPLMGQLSAGHIVLTTRRDLDWRRIADPIRLDVLDPKAATRIISMRTRHGAAADNEIAARIAAELGYLPLALDQAAAYISEQHMTAADYLESLHRHPARIYATAGSGEAQQTIARLWDISIAAICSRNPAAARLLQVIAHYAPDAIPRSMLGADHLREDTNERLGLLASYSLITLTPKDVSIHRLLQAVVLSALDEAAVNGPGARDAALDWLVAAFPDDAADVARWPSSRALLPHAEALCNHYSPDDQPEQLGRLYSRIGVFYQSQGSHKRALAQHRSALAVAVKTLGPEHPDIAKALGNLASACMDTGRVDEAVSLGQQALTVTEKNLGHEHPDTARVLGNLAATYRLQWRPRDALTLQLRALAIAERTLGPEHPDTARALGNLACVYTDLGQVDDARPLELRALRIFEVALGPEHPDTARALQNLAASYIETGEPRQAQLSARRAVRITEKTSGPEHPDTARALVDLAATYRALKRPRKALPLQQRALGIFEVALGSEHLDTARALESLAVTFRALKRPREALARLQQALDTTEASLGLGHPATAVILRDLAVTYTQLRQPGEALRSAQRALQITKATLGRDHPIMVDMLAITARAWRDMGDDATELYIQAREIVKRLNDANHTTYHTEVWPAYVRHEQIRMRADDFQRIYESLKDETVPYSWHRRTPISTELHREVRYYWRL